MSHFVTVKTQIKDIGALKSACQELGLEVRDNDLARGFINARTQGKHVIKLKGPYDIAVNPQPDGTFGMTCDWFNGHVAKEVGEGYQRLLQLYAVHKATAAAKQQGYTVTRQPGKNGSIQLRVCSFA